MKKQAKKKVTKKVKIKKVKGVNQFDLAVNKLFDKWSEGQNKKIDEALAKFYVENTERAKKVSEEQLRHMVVVEEFLKIQTEIFKQLTADEKPAEETSNGT